MKKNLITLFLCLTGLFALSNVWAQADHSFTYQGELLDAGVPANDTYDMTVTLIDGSAQTVGTASVHNGVTVSNGLFTLNVLIGGINAFDGYENYYLEIAVRKTSVGGAYTTLSPLQQLQSVPLASNLVNGAATTGQVLTFNGFQWAPSNLPTGGSSVWNTVGSTINYTAGSVGIGVTAPETDLHVKSTNGWTASFDGGTRMYVGFFENGAGRGYIGSYAQGAGINDEDFEIGTYETNNTGNLQFSIQNDPQMTIANNGNVGIGELDPTAKLHIKGTTGGDIIRARVDNITKFYLDENGGVGVGSYNTPPTNGLRVSGDVKQPILSNGMMKYMVYITNCGLTTPVINRSYNGVSTTSISVADGSSAGECIITFPNDINSRYWQVTALGNGGRAAQCTQGVVANNNQLSCTRFLTSTGAGSAGSIMVLIY